LGVGEISEGVWKMDIIYSPFEVPKLCWFYLIRCEFHPQNCITHNKKSGYW